eukprot:7589038-Pyramimonas_sp.AAC.1
MAPTSRAGARERVPFLSSADPAGAGRRLRPVRSSRAGGASCEGGGGRPRPGGDPARRLSGAVSCSACGGSSGI